MATRLACASRNRRNKSGRQLEGGSIPVMIRLAGPFGQHPILVPTVFEFCLPFALSFLCVI
jgi:hypothetical protein